MFIVYALLNGHPASSACEQFIRSRTGWFTTTLNLLEVKAVLSKVYGVDASLASAKLTQFAMGPVAVIGVDAAAMFAALHLADTLHLDHTDAFLLNATQACNAAFIATDDQHFAQACTQSGIRIESPMDRQLRQEIASWEIQHLPARGLPRVLRQVHQWLSQVHPSAAGHFWSQTGGGSHVP